MGWLETDVGTSIEQTPDSCTALRAAGLEAICQPINLPARESGPEKTRPSTTGSSGLGLYDEIFVPRNGKLEVLEREPSTSARVGMLTPQALTRKDFAILLEENFERIDTNKDGILRRVELETFAARETETLQSREAARVAALHNEPLGSFAANSNKQFETKIGTDLSGAVDTFDRLFGEKNDVGDNQGITTKDLQVLKLLQQPDAFESDVNKARKSERIWGGVSIALGVVGLGVMAYLTYGTKSWRASLGYAYGGAQSLNTLISGIELVADSRVEPALRAEFNSRQEMLQSWNYFSR